MVTGADTRLVCFHASAKHNKDQETDEKKEPSVVAALTGEAPCVPHIKGKNNEARRHKNRLCAAGFAFVRKKVEVCFSPSAGTGRTKDQNPTNHCPPPRQRGKNTR